MKKIFCDACGKECKNPKRFSGPCHLFEFRGKLGYVDSEGPTSGRSSDYDLCSPCWNMIYGEASKKFFEIKNSKPSKEGREE